MKPKQLRLKLDSLSEVFNEAFEALYPDYQPLPADQEQTTEDIERDRVMILNTWTQVGKVVDLLIQTWDH